MNIINKESNFQEIAVIMKDSEIEGYTLSADPSGTYCFQKESSQFQYYINPNFKEIGTYEVEVYWSDYFLKSLGEKNFKKLSKEDLELILSKSIKIIEKDSLTVKGNHDEKYFIPIVLKETFYREANKATDEENIENFNALFLKYLIN